MTEQYVPAPRWNPLMNHPPVQEGLSACQWCIVLDYLLICLLSFLIILQQVVTPSTKVLYKYRLTGEIRTQRCSEVLCVCMHLYVCVCVCVCLCVCI